MRCAWALWLSARHKNPKSSREFLELDRQFFHDSPQGAVQSDPTPAPCTAPDFSFLLPADGKEVSVDWLFLPDEIVLNVFVGLSATDLARCQRVCRTWRRLANDSAISTDLNFARNLHPDDVTLISHLKRNPHLRLLNLAGCQSVSNNGLSVIHQYAREKFQVLRVNGCRWFNDSSIAALGNLKFPYLHTLEIAYCANVSILGIDMLIEICPVLTRLDVHGCDRLDDDALLYLIRRCRSLRHLDCSQCWTTTNFLTELREIDSKDLPLQLRSLRMTMSSWSSPQPKYDPKRNLPKFFPKGESPQKAGAAEKRAQRSLKSSVEGRARPLRLDLVGAPFNTRAMAEHLLKTFPLIDELILTSCYGVKHQSLENFIATHSLPLVRLRRCTNAANTGRMMPSVITLREKSTHEIASASLPDVDYVNGVASAPTAAYQKNSFLNSSDGVEYELFRRAEMQRFAAMLRAKAAAPSTANNFWTVV